MKVWSFYDPTTGLFTGHVLSGSDNDLAANLPENLAAIQGRYDRLSQRVNVETQQVEDWQPPQPDDDHEWRAEAPDAPTRAEQRWRWVKKADVVERERRAAQAQAKINDMERSAARAMREALLLLLPESPERQRLTEVEQRIASLRGDLAAQRRNEE